jgi:hypothetical protein
VQKRRVAVAKKAKRETETPDILEIISRLLALYVVKDMPKDDAVLQLSAVGFADRNVSDLLGVTESSVRGLRFRRAKQPAKKATKVKKSKGR